MEQQSLFSAQIEENTPLASRLRPQTPEEYIGQEHLLGEGCVLARLIQQDRVPSMIFWGPPGVGKTTLARIIAKKTKAAFLDFSAANNGIKEIREIMRQAEQNTLMGERTIIFIDEIHRFNKAQQDAFLPFVEKGAVILIGATTENPSFEVVSALLSRCKVFVLHPLTVDELSAILRNAIKNPRGFGNTAVDITDEQVRIIATFANGDARTLLNTLEMVLTNSPEIGGKIKVSDKIVEQCINKKLLLYDKSGDEHFNLISALHKSMRNSDVQASVYWLARMLEAGENPLYIARRVTRFASEDVGMADSRALEVAVAAYHACHFIGMPECSVHLTHAVTYCALAPKSNALDVAYNAAKRDALDTLSEPVPLVIRNAPTQLMRELEYGKGYKYAHDYAEKVTDMQCLPDALKSRRYYVPTGQGQEVKVGERMRQLENQEKA
jgi:putative ATPase